MTVYDPSGDYATVQEACNALRWQTDGEPWDLDSLIRMGLVPHFYLTPLPYLPQAIFARHPRGCWARVAFIEGNCGIEFDGDEIIVRQFTTPGGDVTSVPFGMYMPVSQLRFRWIDLESPFQMAGRAIAVYRIAPSASSGFPVERSVPKQLSRRQQQDNRLLEILRELGFDPADLPDRAPGKSGPKSLAWAVVREKERRLFTESSFRECWLRLRSDGRIRGSD